MMIGTIEDPSLSSSSLFIFWALEPEGWVVDGVVIVLVVAVVVMVVVGT